MAMGVQRGWVINFWMLTYLYGAGLLVGTGLLWRQACALIGFVARSLMIGPEWMFMILGDLHYYDGFHYGAAGGDAPPVRRLVR